MESVPAPAPPASGPGRSLARADAGASRRSTGVAAGAPASEGTGSHPACKLPEVKLIYLK